MRIYISFFFIALFMYTGFSQETEANSILNTGNRFLKYDASGLQLNVDAGSNSLAGAIYSLENITPGLSLRAENNELETPSTKYFSMGYSLKYYLGNSDFYILGGAELLLETPIITKRRYNFGLSAGMGYDVSNNMQIEGRTFHSLYNNSPDRAFQPAQVVPFQPISLGFKTKF